MTILHVVPMLSHPVLHCFTTPRAITPDELDDPLEHASDAPDSPPSPKGHGRQKTVPKVMSSGKSQDTGWYRSRLKHKAADISRNAALPMRLRVSWDALFKVVIRNNKTYIIIKHNVP